MNHDLLGWTDILKLDPRRIHKTDAAINISISRNGFATRSLARDGVQLRVGSFLEQNLQKPCVQGAHGSSASDAECCRYRNSWTEQSEDEEPRLAFSLKPSLRPLVHTRLDRFVGITNAATGSVSSRDGNPKCFHFDSRTGLRACTLTDKTFPRRSQQLGLTHFLFSIPTRWNLANNIIPCFFRCLAT